MNMNKIFFPKKEPVSKWRLIDAKGKIVGRLATHIADVLRGKDKPVFTHHADMGDYIVIINAKELVFTGNKLKQKIYERYTGYIGNKKSVTAEVMLEKKPEQIIELAVKRMLPKNKLSAKLLKKLKVYAGPEHPHQAQINAHNNK